MKYKENGSSIRFFSSIAPRKIEWLWYPYIPYGKITLIEGDPGDGKTSLVLSLLAMLSNEGVTPDGVTHPDEFCAIYQFAEDGSADTIVPRLLNFGADLSKIAFLDSDVTSLTDSVLWDAVQQIKAKVVVFDPVQAFLHKSDDMKNFKSIRATMKKLAGLAENSSCVVILIGHLNKSENSRTLYRGLGSIDLSAAARSVLFVSRLKEKSNVRILSQAKNSLAAEGADYAFEIDENGKLGWIGPYAAGDFTDDDSDQRIRIPKVEMAAQYLVDWLSDGDLPSLEIFRRAQEKEIGSRTVERAKMNLDITAIHKEDGWYWHLTNEIK